MNIQGFYEVFACQVSQPVSLVSGVDSVPWPRVSRSDDVWSLVMSLMISMWSLCKWSVIGGWVSDKRLPATKRVMTGLWWQGNWTQVDRTSLFLIESEIQRLCLITARDNRHHQRHLRPPPTGGCGRETVRVSFSHERSEKTENTHFDRLCLSHTAQSTPCILR